MKKRVIILASLGLCIALAVMGNRPTLAFGGEWLLPFALPFIDGAVHELKKGARHD